MDNDIYNESIEVNIINIQIYQDNDIKDYIQA